LRTRQAAAAYWFMIHYFRSIYPLLDGLRAAAGL
jgi:hypothetical protein